MRGLRPGQDVLGFCPGAFAEYARTRADLVVPKPDGLSFEQAAALPMAATTALRGIRDVGQVQAGQQVLVNSTAGGVGSYAVQITAALGATVTGVCSTHNLDLVRSLGAARAVDYSAEDFTGTTTRYDVVLDNVGNRPLSHLRRVLTPAGTLVLNAGSDPVITVMPPASAAARQVLRAYFAEVASRYYGRPATDEEVAAAMREEPSDDLAPPGGLLLVAVQDGAVLGCAGLRLLPGGIGEVTRVYVMPAARRRGLGSRLLDELEAHARDHKITTLRLDTRRDLVRGAPAVRAPRLPGNDPVQPRPLLRSLVRERRPVRYLKGRPAGHLTSGLPAPEGPQDSVSASSDTAVRGSSSASTPQRANAPIAYGAVCTSAASNECPLR